MPASFTNRDILNYDWVFGDGWLITSTTIYEMQFLKSSQSNNQRILYLTVWRKNSSTIGTMVEFVMIINNIHIEKVYEWKGKIYASWC